MNMRRRTWILGGVAAAIAVAAVAYGVAMSWRAIPADYSQTGRPARIDPDYSGCTIPPNIAPLNFTVNEEGAEYRVRVYATQGEEILVAGKSPRLILPPAKWNALLEANRGGELHLDVYARQDGGQWRRYDTITNNIAAEDVDPYVVYRRLRPVHNIFRTMGIYQRELNSYDESELLRSARNTGRCMNCHQFTNYRPDAMCMHMRSRRDGLAMILAKNGKVSKIDTRTALNSAPASYSSWHPNGRLVAFSAIQVVQFHHSAGNSDDVFVHGSEVCVYDTETNTVSSRPELVDPDYLSIFPSWSPDGKYLYFCRAKRLWPKGLKNKKQLPGNVHLALYDLMRISFDEPSGAWGEMETLLSSKDTGMSINEPRVSPDGRYLLFCMADYGCFPVFRQSSDLYLMDLDTGKYRPLSILNSEYSESWPSWSSNGRWILFPSKRRDGLFGRAFLSYFDSQGKAHKPILLPQKDPARHTSSLDCYNAPEFIVEPVLIEQEEFLEAAKQEPLVAKSAGMAPSSHEPGSKTTEPAADESSEHAQKNAQPAKTLDIKNARNIFDLAVVAEREGKIDEAVKKYRELLESTPQNFRMHLSAANNLAWIHATNPSDKARDGDKAMVLAERVCRITRHTAETSKNPAIKKAAAEILPSYLETQAAAFAECGRFPQAIRVASEAEKLALKQGQVDRALKIRKQLNLYLLHKPYRTNSP